jgi:prepilin-type N-terminal cleavage/methylation domain-containing protein
MQRGFTLIEVMVTLVILVAVVVIVSSLAVESARSHSYADRAGRATEMNQEILDQFRLDLLSSVRLFENNDLGNAYLAMIDNSGKPCISRCLPTLDADGSFRKEATSGELTGNSMLFARHAWTDEVQVSSGKKYRTDIYRILYYYLATEGNGPTPGSSIGLNLCRWVSEPLIDGNQIDDIADPVDREEVLDHLLNMTPDVLGDVRRSRAEVVWYLAADPTVRGTFRQVEAGGLLNDRAGSSRGGKWKILSDPIWSTDGLLHHRHFSVSTNHALKSIGVSRYSVMDNTDSGFPHGFEVQCIGPSSARQVLIQLCLTSTRRAYLPASSTLRSIVTCRDL